MPTYDTAKPTQGMKFSTTAASCPPCTTRRFTKFGTLAQTMGRINRFSSFAPGIEVVDSSQTVPHGLLETQCVGIYDTIESQSFAFTVTMIGGATQCIATDAADSEWPQPNRVVQYGSATVSQRNMDVSFGKEATDFVIHVMTACRSASKLRDAIDLVNDFFSSHLSDQDYESCNTALRCLALVKLPRHVAVMVLVVTAHIPKQKLPARESFYRKVVDKWLPLETDPRNHRYLEALA